MVSLKQIIEPEETALSTQLVEAKCEQVCGKFLYWEKVVVIIIVPFTQLDSSDSVNYVIKEMTYLKLRDILRNWDNCYSGLILVIYILFFCSTGGGSLLH